MHRRPRRLMRPALVAGLVGLVGALLVAGPGPATTPTIVLGGHDPHEQLASLDAERAWELTTGSGVVVAVLDSGVDADHPALADRVLPGRDFVDGSTDGRVDPVGHGTTVASLVAGAGEEATGLAPDATILPVRVLDENNRYESAATVADGVVWAVDNGAQVINLSLGGRRDSASLGEALSYALAHDVVVIACTGNYAGDDYREVWYPAREPGVIAVAGLTTSEDGLRRWRPSLTGPETVLAAPAVVTGARAGGGHRDVQGTSFASALTAGAAALVRAQWPELPAADVVNRLVATAEDLGTEDRDPVFGFGALRPLAALTHEVPPVPTNPLDTKARQQTVGLGAAPSHAPGPAAAAPAPGTTLPATGAGRLLPGGATRALPPTDGGAVIGDDTSAGSGTSGGSSGGTTTGRAAVGNPVVSSTVVAGVLRRSRRCRWRWSAARPPRPPAPPRPR